MAIQTIMAAHRTILGEMCWCWILSESSLVPFRLRSISFSLSLSLSFMYYWYCELKNSECTERKHIIASLIMPLLSYPEILNLQSSPIPQAFRAEYFQLRNLKQNFCKNIMYPQFRAIAGGRKMHNNCFFVWLWKKCKWMNVRLS